MTDRYLGLPLEFWTPGFLGLPFPIWTFALTAVGLIVGSFLNVVIHRLPRNESVVSPPSHCPKCGNQIPLRQNLPIVSWLWLRGRCGYCGAPISPRYLAVEAVTGIIFVTTWLTFGRETPLAAMALCVLFAGFIAATFIDVEHLIIPDEITLGGMVAGFLFSAAAPALQHSESAVQAMKRSGLGVAVGAGVVYLVLRGGKLVFGRERKEIPAGARVVFHESGIALPDGEIPYEDVFYRGSDAVRLQASRLELTDRCYWDQPVELRLAAEPATLRVGDEKFPADQEPFMAVETERVDLPREAMGLGDVKFMAAIGAFLGWQATIFSLLFSAIIGTVVAVALIALGRQTWSGRLGYGPYIAAAAMVWVFGGRTFVYHWFGL